MRVALWYMSDGTKSPKNMVNHTRGIEYKVMGSKFKSCANNPPIHPCRPNQLSYKLETIFKFFLLPNWLKFI